jgi:CBS domain-containing protein
MSLLHRTARRFARLAPHARSMSMLLNRSLKVSEMLELQGQHDRTTTQAVDVGDNLTATIALMTAHNVGSVVVLAQGKVIGMLSERDVLCKVGGQGLDPQSATVGEVGSMGHAASRCVTPIYTARQCLSLMAENRYRHMPVVSSKASDDAEYLGMVSILDLVLQGMHCADIVPSAPATDGSKAQLLQRAIVSDALSFRRKTKRIGYVNVSSAASVADTAAAMAAGKCGCALVIDDDQMLAGVFTDRDFLDGFASDRAKAAATAVGDTMHTDREVALVTPETSMERTFLEMRTMLAAGNRRLHFPVVRAKDHKGGSALRTAFDDMDLNGDGVVTSAELQQSGNTIRWQNDDAEGVVLVDDLLKYLYERQM